MDLGPRRHSAAAAAEDPHGIDLYSAASAVGTLVLEEEYSESKVKFWDTSKVSPFPLGYTPKLP